MKGRVRQRRPSRSYFRTLTIVFTTVSRQSELMTKGDKNLYMTFEQIGTLYNVTFPASTD